MNPTQKTILWCVGIIFGLPVLAMIVFLIVAAVVGLKAIHP